MSEHTPGPWKVQVEEEDGLQNISIEEIHRALHDSEWADPEDFERDLANACRIVACVNACEGMADPEAEIKALRAEVATPVLVATNRLADALADARAENTRLRDNFALIIAARDKFKAENARFREALKEAQGYMCDGMSSYKWLEAYKIISAALGKE
jgi:hypothetical protein